MRLTPHIFVRVGKSNNSIILETRQGADELDPIQLNDLIINLKKINRKLNFLPQKYSPRKP
ncbi:MAG: hypothetical protein ACFE9L_18320, partial [Candidatus Hodarchaeota archaeon]